jgi:hypothetical protein
MKTNVLLLALCMIISAPSYSEDWEYDKCDIDSLVNLKTLEVKLSILGIGKDKIFTLEFPNYTTIPCSVWGDWGPMYTFPKVEGGVTFTYTKNNKKESFKTDDYIFISSPMLWKVREKYPLYQEIPLPDSGIVLKVWYENDKLGYVELKSGSTNSFKQINVLKHTTY